MEALSKATEGRKGHEPLFLRPEKERVTFTTWKTVGRGPWYAASELVRPWGKIVAEAGLPAETIPYALRHSSIVRSLREGLGTEHVGKLHDTSSSMIARHYAAFIVEALDEIAAKAAISFAPSTPPPPPSGDNVVAYRGRAS